jgi:hypothetical protein
VGFLDRTEFYERKTPLSTFKEERKLIINYPSQPYLHFRQYKPQHKSFCKIITYVLQQTTLHSSAAQANIANSLSHMGHVFAETTLITLHNEVRKSRKTLPRNWACQKPVSTTASMDWYAALRCEQHFHAVSIVRRMRLTCKTQSV